MKPDKIVPAVLMFVFVAGVIGLIGIWYLALFAMALIVFIIFLVAQSKSKKTTNEVLQFRPGKEIPAAVWVLTENAPTTNGPSRVEVALVELDKYEDNWENFRDVAQVDRSGVVNVQAHLFCYKTPTGDRGMVLAHERRVLGEIRKLDLDTYFEPFWSRGGHAAVRCHFTFAPDLTIAKAIFEIQAYDQDAGDKAPEQGAYVAWKMIWRAVQGKSPR